MSSGGSLVRQQRKKRGMSQQALGELIGASGPTINRIEKGRRIPTDKEIERLAFYLDLAQDRLTKKFDEDRQASISYPGSTDFSDYLHMVDAHIETIELFRMHGRPVPAIERADILIDTLRKILEAARVTDKSELRRLLAKALLTRAIALTLVVTRVGDDTYGLSHRELDEIREYSSFLRSDEGDALFRDMALMLPEMVFYLSKEWDLAEAWLAAHLPQVQTPYIRGIGLRDRIVITGIKRDYDAYKHATRQAMQMIDSGLLEPIDQARVFEGRTVAAIRLTLAETQEILRAAETAYADAARQGAGRPSVRAQIDRTTVMYWSRHKQPDENRILEVAKSAVSFFRACDFGRYIAQVKEFLRGIQSRKIKDFCSSL